MSNGGRLWRILEAAGIRLEGALDKCKFPSPYNSNTLCGSLEPNGTCKLKYVCLSVSHMDQVPVFPLPPESCKSHGVEKENE